MPQRGKTTRVSERRSGRSRTHTCTLFEAPCAVFGLLSTQAELSCDCGVHDPGNEAVEREFAQIMGELAACGNQCILCLGPTA